MCQTCDDELLEEAESSRRRITELERVAENVLYASDHQSPTLPEAMQAMREAVRC